MYGSLTANYLTKHADLFATSDHVDSYQDGMTVLSKLGIGGTLLLSLLTGQIAVSGMRAKDKKDKIDPKQSKEWMKKYLNSKNIYLQSTPGENNASYQNVKDEAGNKHHLIRYDPELNKSVMAHEIGHGMTKIPRLALGGLSGVLGPMLMATGAINTGGTLGLENNSNFFGHGDLTHPLSLPALLAGTALYAPTIANEWGASHNAKKILKENNIKPKGLKRALTTYTVPVLGALGLGGAAYGIGREA